MKNYLIPILLVFGILSSCTSGHETTSSAENHIVLKPFSDSIKIDTFKVALKGDAVKDMTIQFSITAYDGKLIYSKDFKAKDLIDNYKSTVDLKKNAIRWTLSWMNISYFWTTRTF